MWDTSTLPAQDYSVLQVLHMVPDPAFRRGYTSTLPLSDRKVPTPNPSHRYETAMSSTNKKTVRLVGTDGGTGLSRNLRLFEEILRSAGHTYEWTAPTSSRRGDRLFALAARAGLRKPQVDLQLFSQDLSPRLLPFARRNLLVPYQEWFDVRSLRLLRGIDTILCQSEHAAEIFRPYHPDVRSLSFTSVDRGDQVEEADRTRILHVAGRSPFKGTEQIARIWMRHPEWPMLTITHAEGILPKLAVKNIEQHIGHLPDEQLRRFQNEAWLHIQTSEAEGFGHCLVEAMSCGGAVLTVDAPPMNELFSATAGEGFVVPFSDRIPLNLGFRFIADEAALDAELERLIALGREGTRSIGDAARRNFVGRDQRVRAAYRSVFLEP